MPLFIIFLILLVCPLAAKGEQVRFLVVDAKTRAPLTAAKVTLQEVRGSHVPVVLPAGAPLAGITPTFDLRAWKTGSVFAPGTVRTIIVPEGGSVLLAQQVQGSEPPVRDIYIKVTVTRVQVHPSETGTGTTRDNRELNTFVNRTSNDARQLTQGQSGVTTDSNGQQHVRGEHTDITYVVDGVPLPDTLSGRQNSIVVPSTIDSLDIVTGGFAPEFGGQTAAILNITTTPGSRTPDEDLTFQGGSYDTTNGELTAAGPLGKRASYVVNIGANRSRNALEPQQPDDQTAHNTGSDLNFFTKFRFTPSRRDTLNLTLSSAPGTLQLSTRTGLPASFTTLGQGFGFLGLRNADGTRPDATIANPDGLGAQTLLLPSQQTEGMDIDQREINEFATLSWRRQLSTRDTGLLAITWLHSGQDVSNHNPAVDLLNLPVDNSIEYNPTAHRNIHHVQVVGSVASKRGTHQLKAGFVLDDQNGKESYNLVPASQLALNALAALSPGLAPAGSVQTDVGGNPVTDVNGNPVYVPTSRATPTLLVHRSGFYRAAYLQDTWQPTRRFTINYGLRADWYKQSQTLGQATIDTIALSPRLNFSYALDKVSVLRWSYDRLFNTPPLAQGAIVGQPIVPETLDQYDLSYEREVAPGQTIKLAYYVKDIRNQVDVGLLIPGSQIGLYSGLTFQYGGVHGIEFSYDLVPKRSSGLDAYVNYTYSIARPNGVDNTGAPVPDFNDHDQRNTVGVGVAYTWKNQASVALTLNHGSGLASSAITVDGRRIPRTEVDLRYTSGPHLFRGKGGIGLDIENLFDDRTVINYESAFSGTRFMQGRRILFSLFGNF